MHPPNSCLDDIREPVGNKEGEAAGSGKFCYAAPLLGDIDDVRTLNRKLGRQYQHLVNEVYSFFRQRSSCPCSDCQSDFSDSDATLRRIRKRKRWNSPPALGELCFALRSVRSRDHDSGKRPASLGSPFYHGLRKPHLPRRQ